MTNNRKYSYNIFQAITFAFSVEHSITAAAMQNISLAFGLVAISNKNLELSM
jgi:hypothetical protein